MSFDPREKGYKWTFIVYPDSAPDDWQTQLDNLLIPCCYSPMHEPEAEGKEEEKLKQHWHVIIDYGKSVKTRNQVRKICQDMLHGTDCEVVQSPIGIYEYLIHKNHPERQQFKNGFDAITHMNGFDIEEFVKLNSLDNFDKILQAIEDNNFMEFASVVAYIRDKEPDLLGAMRKDAYFINSYLRSRKNIYREYIKNGE